MKKQNLATATPVVALALLGVLASSSFLSGCGKEEKKIELMGEGDNNSGPNRQKKLDSLSENYQTSFTIPSGENGYENEYLINRGLRFFQRNHGAYKEKLKNCSQVILTTQGTSHWEHPSTVDSKTGQSIPSGKMVLVINVTEQEMTWRRLVENFEDFDLAAQRLVDLEKQLRGELHFEDKLGLNSEEVATFAAAFADASKGLDFHSIPVTGRTIRIDSKDGFSPNFLLVEPGKEAAYYRDSLIQVIELHRVLKKNLDALQVKTGKTVVLQDGVLVPAEIIRGMAMLDGNAPLFANSNRQFDTIMLGRRFEESKDRIRGLQTFLVPFDATAKQLEEAIALFDAQWDKLAELAFRDAQNFYKVRGMTLSIGNPSANSEASLNKLKAALDRLMAAASPEKLAPIGVTTIASSSGPALISGATLSLNMLDFRTADVDAEVGRIKSTKETAERLAAQRSVMEGLSSAYSSVSVSWTEAELEPTSPQSTLKLSQFVDRFKRRATPARLQECKVRRIVVVKSSLAQEQVVFTNDEVRVNPYTMEESVLEDRIREKIQSLQPLPPPPPAPAPTPVAPAPVPTPAPVVPAPSPTPSPSASASAKPSTVAKSKPTKEMSPERRRAMDPNDWGFRVEVVNH